MGGAPTRPGLCPRSEQRLGNLKPSPLSSAQTKRLFPGLEVGCLRTIVGLFLEVTRVREWNRLFPFNLPPAFNHQAWLLAAAGCQLAASWLPAALHASRLAATHPELYASPDRLLLSGDIDHGKLGIPPLG